MIKKLGILFLLFVSFFILGVDSVDAIQIQDPIQDTLVADPGERVTGVFGVVNNTETAKRYHFSTQAFGAVGEYGDVEFSMIDKNDEFALGNWIELPDTLELGPGESARLEFAINVPEFADPGGHYGAIFVTDEEIGDKTNVVFLKTQVSILVLLRVNGDVKEDVSLLSFDTKGSKRIYDRLPVEFETRAQNNGTIHLKPTGYVKIGGLIMRDKRVEANIKSGNIMPNTIRRFESLWTKDENIPVEKAGFFTELKYEFQNFGFGPYDAELHFMWGTGKMLNVEKRYTHFWVIPWRIILSVIVLILFIYYALIKPYNYFVGKKYEKKMSKKKATEKKKN